MYLYHNLESDEFFCTEDELDIESPECPDCVEIGLEEFLKQGDKADAFFYVSQSKVKLFRRCHYAYHLKYVKKIQKRIKAKPLFMGIIVHEAIELWLKGKPWKKIISKAQKELDGMFDEEAVDLQDVVPTSKSMIEGYIKANEEDGLTPEEVELNFKVPLVDNIILQGKVDSLQRESKKALWQVEHKTCANIPSEKNRMSDIQTLIYHWALPRAGYDQPIGVIWDYLRKKLPTVPKLLKNEELSRAKNIDTTYDVYLQAIKDNKLKVKDYREILEDLRGREDNFFRRIKMPISESAVRSVVEDFQSTAIQMKEIGHIVKDRNMTRDCSWCDNYPICQSEFRDGDTEALIKREYTTEEQRDAQKKRKVKKGKK